MAKNIINCKKCRTNLTLPYIVDWNNGRLELCSTCFSKIEKSRRGEMFAYCETKENDPDGQIGWSKEKNSWITLWDHKERVVYSPKKEDFPIKGQGSGDSYGGTEIICSECRSATIYKRDDDNSPSAFKCKDEKTCLQYQRDKLKELQEKTSRSEEEQTEMIRLGNKLGVDIKYPRGSESDKKYLEIQINQLLKALKASKQLPKNYPGLSEYDRQQIESKLVKLKKEYKDKYGELPSSLRDDNDDQEREREREREPNPTITEQNCWTRSHC